MRKILRNRWSKKLFEGFIEYILDECGLNENKQGIYIANFLSHCENYLIRNLPTSKTFETEEEAIIYTGVISKLQTRHVLEGVLETFEVAQLLKCSRQNIDYLVSKGKIAPLKRTKHNKYFLKSDVEKLASEKATCAVALPK